MSKNSMSRLFRFAIATAALFTLSACGDDNPTDVNTGDLGEEASMEIAMELMGQMAGIGYAPSEFGDAPARSFSIVPGEPAFAETIEFTGDCAEGGTMEITGTVDDNVDADGNGSVSVDIRQRPMDCGVQTSEGLFIVSGDPDLRFTADMTFENEEPVGNVSFALNGGFSWTGGAGEGRCSMNMSMSFNFQDESAVSVSGSVCGHPLQV